MTRITELAGHTADLLDGADLLPVVDVSDTTMAATGTTKKISVASLIGVSEPMAATGDTTGAADLARLNAALTGWKDALIGPGSFYFGGSAPVTVAAGRRVRGCGMDQTTCFITAAATYPELFSMTGAATISDLFIRGTSGTITSNPEASAIMIDAGTTGFRCRLDRVRYQYINGWGVDLESNSSSTHFSANDVFGWNSSGGMKLEGGKKSIGCNLVGCGSAQIGVASGGFANLDGLLIAHATDVTGSVAGFSTGKTTTGHGIHVLGSSQIYFHGVNLGGYPTPDPGSGQCGILVEGNGTDGNVSGVRFSNGIIQTWDIGARVTGNVTNCQFESLNFGGNESHGLKNDCTWANCVFVRDCVFGLTSGTNGQGGVTLGAGVSLYDLYWNSTAACRISGCEFGSPIVAAGAAPGVQASVAIPSGNNTQVIYPRFIGTGQGSGNWFTNTPANLVKF